MSFSAGILALSGDDFAVVVWVLIVFGASIVKAIRKVLKAGADSNQRRRAQAEARKRWVDPSAEIDLDPGKELWKRLLAGEEEAAPAPPPAVVPSSPEPDPMPVRRTPPDEGLVLPVSDENYAVATGAYEMGAREEHLREQGDVTRPHEDAGESRRRPRLVVERDSLRNAILWSEILGPPVALRRDERCGGLL